MGCKKRPLYNEPPIQTYPLLARMQWYCFWKGCLPTVCLKVHKIICDFSRQRKPLTKKIGPATNKSSQSAHFSKETNGNWEVVKKIGCCLILLDGSEFPFPTTFWMFLKPVVNNGLNYQLQLVSLPDFWTINSRNGYYQPQPVSAGFLNHQQYVEPRMEIANFVPCPISSMVPRPEMEDPTTGWPQ